MQSNEMPNSQEVTAMIEHLSGDQTADYLIKDSDIDQAILKKLVDFADATYQESLKADNNSGDVDDLKIDLTRDQLVGMVGDSVCQRIEKMFDSDYTDIIIRRCQTHGKHINFHTDVSQKTLQISLNSDSEYEGGRLVYATKGKLEAPRR